MSLAGGARAKLKKLSQGLQSQRCPEAEVTTNHGTKGPLVCRESPSGQYVQTLGVTLRSAEACAEVWYVTQDGEE